MSELFDKIVESAGQVISEVDKGGQIQSAVGGLRHRLAEAERRRKTGLVKQQVRDLQTKEAQAINALSAQVLALHEAGSLTQPELISLCQGVDAIRTQIEEKEAELQQIKPAEAEAVPEARCPSCKAPVVVDATFCQSCGTRLAEEEAPPPVLFCVHCGAQLRENARFCPKCGQTVPQT
jgi:membrane protease subunit (stomatin/prohibitin family)